MPINPLSGRSPPSLTRPLQPPRCRHRHWKGAPASQIIFLAVFRSENGRIEGQSDSEREWLKGGRVVGLAALRSDVTRRNSPLSTSSTYFRGPQEPVGRNTRLPAKTQGQRRPPPSIWVSKEGSARSGGRRMEGGQRTRCLPVAQSPPPSSCHEIIQKEKREGGREGHKATHTSRTRLVAVHAQSKHDGLGDGRRMRMASMMATSRQVRVWSRWG